MSMDKGKIELVLLQCNGNLKEASKILNVSYKTLYYHISKNKIPYNNLRSKIILDEELVANLYQKHQSLSLVAKELGRSKEGIRGFMNEHNIKINEPIRYSFNDEFFNYDSEKSFYWAGFLAADGCLKKHGNSDELSLALSVKDREHVDLFKHDLDAEHPVHEYIIKKEGYSDCKKAEICLLSDKLPNSLGRFNITTRKTFTYTFPEWVISHKYVNHFMRGYFDGDGSFYIGASKKTKQFCFNIVGTHDFTYTYRSILERVCNIEKRIKDIPKKRNVFVLEYGGNGVISKIRDFLYKDAVTFLPRKYDLVKDIVTVERISITAEELINLVEMHGSFKEVAKILGCSRTNIHHLMNKFGIREQVSEAKARYLLAVNKT